MKFFTSIVIATLLLCSQTSSANENAVTIENLEMSGYMDVVNVYQESSADVSEFSLGEAEIGLFKNLSPKSSIEVAVAYNQDDSKFELGSAILEMYVFGGGKKNSSSSIFEKSYLSVGMFDVPFGIEYQSYAAIDRKLISKPRVVSLTHEEWNDVGAMLSLNSGLGNLTMYAVNGFESSAEITEQVYNLALSTYEDSTYEVNTTPAAAFGGRLGLYLMSNLEIGASAALGLNKSEKDEMILLGTDMQFSYESFSLRGEYIHHSVNRSIQQENNHGYYVQAVQQFDRYFITGRYGSFQPDNVEWVGQMSVGAGMTLTENVEFRFESLIHETSTNNKTLIQFVAGF